MAEELKEFCINGNKYSKFGDKWFDQDLNIYSSLIEIMAKNGVGKEGPCYSA